MMVPFLRLRFPMKVDVKNPRLICLFYAVQLLMFVFFCVMFWLLDMWAAKTPVGQFIYPTLAVNSLSKQLQEVWADRSQQPFCTAPHTFDYRWDVDGLSTYGNHTCLPLCRINESGLHHQCIHLAETYIAQNMGEVFVTTQIQDTILPVDESRPDGVTRNHFIPTAEGLDVSIRFSYHVPIPPKLQLPAWTQHDFRQTLISGSSTENVVTVVLDSNGNFWGRFLPGEEIQFSIPSLLELAGDPGLLNKPQIHIGRNMLPGAAIPEGPIARLTGLGLEFSLECFDRQYITVPGHDGFQCLLRVNKLLPGWVAVEHSDLLDQEGHHRYRVSHGIRINVRTGGSFRFFSFFGMLRFSTYMIVLMQLPSRFVLFVAVSCLGHLSVVYKKVLFHEFDIYEKVGGFATRLMSSSASFVLLDDTKGQGISKNRMHERLSSAASARKVAANSDKEVIGRFVDYCWHSAVKERNIRASSLQDMVESVSGEISEAIRPRRKSHVDDLRLDLEHFSKACTNNEDIPFEVLIGMFSKHRKRRLMERIFTPANVSRYLAPDIDDDELLDGDQEEGSVTSAASSKSNTSAVSVAQVDSFQESTVEAPVLVSRRKGRCRTLEETKLEVDSDHVRIQKLEHSLFSAEGRLTKLLEELDLRLSNVECRVKDGLEGVESRIRSLEKKAEQLADLLEKRQADVLEKLDRKFEEENEAVAQTVADSVAEAMAAHPLLERLPDFEAELSELVLLYRQIQPGLLEPDDSAQPGLSYPTTDEVDMPEVAGTVYDTAYGYRPSAGEESWKGDPEVAPNDEQPVSYAAWAAQTFSGSLHSPLSSAHGADGPRASDASGCSGWQQSVMALTQQGDTAAVHPSIPAARMGLHRLGRALSPSTLRSLGP